MAHISKDENGQSFIDDPWSIEDIQSQAERIDLEISEAQCLTVMDRIVESFDANVGINWEVIEYHIRDVVSED